MKMGSSAMLAAVLVACMASAALAVPPRLPNDCVDRSVRAASRYSYFPSSLSQISASGVGGVQVCLCEQIRGRREQFCHDVGRRGCL